MEWLTSLDGDDWWLIAIAALVGLTVRCRGHHGSSANEHDVDAISHTVLPGIALAFIITGSRDYPAIGCGHLWHSDSAVDAGLASMGTRNHAATGVVYVFVTLGLVLIERGAQNTGIDADCALYGAIEFALGIP